MQPFGKNYDVHRHIHIESTQDIIGWNMSLHSWLLSPQNGMYVYIFAYNADWYLGLIFLCSSNIYRFKVDRLLLNDLRRYNPALVKEYMWGCFITETELPVCIVPASLDHLKLHSFEGSSNILNIDRIKGSITRHEHFIFSFKSAQYIPTRRNNCTRNQC